MHGGHRPTFWILFLVVVAWGNIRKRPRTFALGRFIGLQSVVLSLLFSVCYFQSVVPSLLFTFSSLQFCTEIYSHTSLMLMLLMTFSPFTVVPSLDGSAVMPSGLMTLGSDAAIKLCISTRVTSVFGVLYAFLFIMLYFYLGYLLDYFLAVHYVYTLLQSVEAVAYILAI